MNTLTATIKRPWLARIIDGSKKIEYRAMSDFWYSRLDNVGPPPFRLRLINGMSPDAPEATVLVDHVDADLLEGEFRLHIQAVLETIRWNPAWHDLYPPLPPEEPFDPTRFTPAEFAESEVELEVPTEILEGLRPGEAVRFSLPWSEETDNQICAAPPGKFIVRLRNGGQVERAGLIEAFLWVFGDQVDYLAVGLE